MKTLFLFKLFTFKIIVISYVTVFIMYICVLASFPATITNTEYDQLIKSMFILAHGFRDFSL